MASLVALKDWLVAGKPLSGVWSDPGNDCRIRALPKEEIVLYVKSIDNRAVVRLSDGRDWAANFSMAGGVLAASVMLILLLLPGGYTLAAGKRLEKLRQEQAELHNELKALRARESALTSPEKLTEYAGTGFVEPAAHQVVFAPPSKGTVASLSQR